MQKIITEEDSLEAGTRFTRVDLIAKLRGGKPQKPRRVRKVDERRCEILEGRNIVWRAQVW